MSRFLSVSHLGSPNCREAYYTMSCFPKVCRLSRQDTCLQRAEAVAAYSTPTGGLIIGACAVMSVVAYRVMIAIGRLPDDPRLVLSSAA